MTNVARRSFLATLGAGLTAPALLRAQSRSKSYPIARPSATTWYLLS